jgi:hypothetical protein
MKAGQEVMGARLSQYEEKLRGLNSYIKELQTMTGKHDTESVHFEEDLIEAEHNIKYYESEIARIKGETGTVHSTQQKPAKRGVAALVFSSIGLVVGGLLGFNLKHRRGDKEGTEQKREQ